jgi:hypothetical protein
VFGEERFNSFLQAPYGTFFLIPATEGTDILVSCASFPSLNPNREIK